MSSDGNWCMRFFWRRKTLKTRILVSNQAVLQTNNTTIGTRNKENNKIFQNRCIQKEIQDHYSATFKKIREGKRRWIKRQIHQLNTMQKNINPRVHTKITHSQSRAHHITSGEQNEPISKHQMQQETNQKEAGSLPNPIHIIQKEEEGQGERTTVKRQKYGGMQEEEEGGGASPHEKTQKKTCTWWRRERQREWIIHPNVQFL